MATSSPHHSNIKRDRKQRQTYPGPNSADNQQMLRDIRHTLDQHQRDIRTPTPTSSVALVATVERQDSSREREHLRRSPPSEAGGGGGSAGSGSPRVQPQSRAAASSATTTAAATSSVPATTTAAGGKQNSSNRKRQLATIRRSLRPFASAHSDPGFHTARDMVDKRALEELISLGYNEVREREREREEGRGDGGGQ